MQMEWITLHLRLPVFKYNGAWYPENPDKNKCYWTNHFPLLVYNLVSAEFTEVEEIFRVWIEPFLCCREKKKEKERDELWKRLGELEINHKDQNSLNHRNENNSHGALPSTAWALPAEYWRPVIANTICIKQITTEEQRPVKKIFNLSVP